MTLYVLVGRTLNMPTGADVEYTPAWFPISSQRIGGEPELPKVGCINPPFLV